MNNVDLIFICIGVTWCCFDLAAQFYSYYAWRSYTNFILQDAFTFQGFTLLILLLTLFPIPPEKLYIFCFLSPFDFMSSHLFAEIWKLVFSCRTKFLMLIHLASDIYYMEEIYDLDPRDTIYRRSGNTCGTSNALA